MQPIYFDHNATTPVAPEVLAAMLPYFSDHFGNPSSVHAAGAEVADALARARSSVARLIGARSPREIVFTSGGTESIQTALRSALALRPKARQVLSSSLEHAAVLAPLDDLGRHGFEALLVNADSEGSVEIDRILNLLDSDSSRAQIAFVSLMAVNNETGVVTDIEALAQVAAACRTSEIPFHVDAVQRAGKLPIKVADIGCDLLSISSHKIYGPKGCGALWVRPGFKLSPLLLGGPQEGDRRAGTENTAAIVGMGAAAEAAMTYLADEDARRQTKALRDHFENGLLAALPGTRVHGGRSVRVDSVSNLGFEGASGEAIVMLLSEYGLCASTGSACSSGNHGASHVLLGMGLDVERAQGAVRFSLGRTSTQTEVDRALELVPRAVNELRSLAP